METRRQGIGVSPGIAIGPAYIVEAERPSIPEYTVSDTEIEVARLEQAVDRVRRDLTALHHRTLAELGEPDAKIIHAHLMLLDDGEVRDTLNQRIHAEARNAEFVVFRLVEEYVTTLKQNGDPAMRERSEDIEDVGDRVVRALLDLQHSDLMHIQEPAVLVAQNLKPTETARLDSERVLGLVLDSGSTTAHSAILARALGIPAVMGLGNYCDSVESDTVIIADGDSGEVIYDPDPATLTEYQERRRQWMQRREAAAHEPVSGPAQTADGTRILLEANLSAAAEAASAKEAYAEGVGLFRTEFLFLSGSSMPTEEEQYETYCSVVKTFSPAPVTLRSMDLGGDKLTDSLAALEEENPQLGWRAIRFCLARPDVFKTQLRAMLRASVFGKVRILFPMISSVDEFRQARAVLDSVKIDLRDEGIDFDPDTPVGAMMEVPSAVIVADRLAPECDFFSIGTNDLIQYTLAVDRGNEKVAHLYEPLDPAVLRMIKMAADAARSAGIPCEMCGAMAGESEFTTLLIGLGITGLSMPALQLSGVRKQVLSGTMTEAQELAQRALACSKADDVRTLLHATPAGLDA